ncbi:MAG: nucleotidyltransferase family protein [Flavobacteriaceae bacterium]|nr:nucleotidyltransferase family protein [Flavobacteriaceae bacterium]
MVTYFLRFLSCALLASGVYNDIGERMVGDIDILVEPEHLHKAERLLKETGYNSLEESLFGKYKDHRHLPRLIHPERLGAVEIHSKLLRKERRNILNIKEILANRRTIKGVCVPTIEANLDILILNHLINDFGYLFKSINLKACYDSLALEQQNEPSTASKTSKYHRLFYTLRALNFKPYSKTSKNTSSTVLKKMYKYLSKKGLVRRFYTRLVNVNIRLITALEGLRLFFKNKHFRAAVWNHKSEVIKLLKDDN